MNHYNLMNPAYNLMDPSELAELGSASDDRLAQYLGASLTDHIAELELLHDGNKELTTCVNNLENHVVPDLETQVERLRATIAALEDAIKAKKKA